MLTACEQRRTEAIILEKEFIAAREPTPTPAEGASPLAISSPDEASEEITVDGYAMKKEARGSGRDPRALVQAQWLVKVRTADSGRILKVQTNETKFAQATVGDRVGVKYRAGKYTGTVWAAELE